MHDAAVVRGLQRGGNGARDVERPRFAERSRGDLRPQRASFQVFRGDEDLIANLFERVDRGDRGMRQRRGGARFLAQARPHPIVPEQMRRQRLQGDRSMQASILREIDDPHAAAPDDPLDAILSDLRALVEQRRWLEKAMAVVV
jgi:hypothetical protein